MKKSFRQIACFGLILLGLLAWKVNAADSLWTTNYAQAQKDAAKAGKSLLMDFSGSDWCGWCIRLDKEVFAQDVFKQAVTKDFVPVLLDYPRDKSKMSEELQAQNERLKNKYNIQGYPTVILADAQGRPYAKTGYQAGGPEAYLQHLAELRQKGVDLATNLKKAEEPGLKPLDRVRLLDKAVSGLDASLLVEFYGDVVDQIMALDKDNRAGIKQKYAYRIRATQAEKALASRDFTKATGLYEAMLRDFQPEGEEAQALYFSLADAYFQAGQKDKAKASLEKAVAIAPETPTAGRIKQVLERYFSDTAKL